MRRVNASQTQHSIMKKYFSLIAVAVLFLLTACRSAQEGMISKPSPKEQAYIIELAKKTLPAPTLVAKTEVNLQMGKKEISLNGTLRMKRDEVVQLSLTFFGIEMARLEFTPEYVLIIDRSNKRVLRADYKNVDFLAQTGVDFHTLQALFWNELFVPGEKNITQYPDVFQARTVGPETVLLLSHLPFLNYEFRTVSDRCQLTQTTVSPKSGKHSVSCHYANFEPLEQNHFPRQMSFSFSGDQKFGLSLSFSRLNCGETFNTRTEVSSRYKALSAEELFGVLSKLL